MNSEMNLNFSLSIVDQSRRRLNVMPSWTTLVIILGLILLFCIILRILKGFSDSWKRMMNRRIAKALELRRERNDPFRNENGYNWDYVMVFKVHKASEKLTQKQKNPELTLKGVVDSLAKAGLDTTLFFSIQNDEVYLKIRGSLKRLILEADRIGYVLLLDENTAANALSIGNLKGPIEKQWKPVSIPKNSPDSETTLEPYSYIYGKFSRALMDRTPIYKTYANNTIFRGVDRLKLISSILKARKENGGCQIDLDRIQTDENIIAFFPLHDYVELRVLEEKWMRICECPWQQNVSAVKDYFGEKVAMYFYWLGFYTSFLTIGAVLGFIAWCVVAADAGNPNNPFMPFFAVFIAVWSSYYLVYWKRAQGDIAMRWGMVGYLKSAEARPMFHGDYVPNPVTGEKYLYFSRSEYYRRVTQSVIIIVALIALVIGLVTSIFYFSITERLSKSFVYGGTDYTGIIAGLLNAVQIQIMNAIYAYVSVQLNDFENHRTDQDYEDALILKTFVFQFVNSFVSLFYIAFVKPFIPDLDACLNSCMTELSVALGSIFLTRLTTGSILKILIPKVQNFLKEREESKGVTRRDAEVSEVEKIYMLTPYSAQMDVFNDYAEMMIQFGYTTMFIVAYPMAIPMAFVNNIVEMKVMAWKLCQLCRRPEPASAEDIGSWEGILDLMVFAAIVTNSALVAFTGTYTLGFVWVARIYIFISMSAGIIAIKLVISFMVPNVSKEVEIQLERQEFIRSKLIDGKPDDREPEINKDQIMSVKYTIRITDDDPL